MVKDDRFKQKGINLLLSKIAGNALIEEKETNLELIKFRRDKCFECPNMCHKNIKCKICGCFLDQKTESRININAHGVSEITHCPIGNWNDEDLAKIYSHNN